MKNFIKPTLLYLLLLIPAFTFAQVNSVKYMLRYNAIDTSLDAYITTLRFGNNNNLTASDRILLMAQYTIVVPTGSSVSIKKSYNPHYTSNNLPIDWEIKFKTEKPVLSPFEDFISISPTLGQVAQFQSIKFTDTIKLFSLKIESINGCMGDIRLYNATVDIPTPGQPWDHTNGFFLGNTENKYHGNVELPLSEMPGLDIISCPETTIDIPKPANFDGTWQILNAVAFPNVSLTTLANGDASLNIGIGSMHNKTIPILYTNGQQTLYKCIRVTEKQVKTPYGAVCIGNEMYLNSPQSGTWSSSDTTVASISSKGIVKGLNTGNVQFSFTPNNASWCTYIPTPYISILPIPIATITGDSLFCDGESITLTAHGGDFYLWTTGATTKSIVISSPGTYSVTVSDLNGCYARTDKSVTTINEDTYISAPDGNRICKGATTLLKANMAGTWHSSRPQTATIHPTSGLVTGIEQGLTTISFTNNVNGCTKTIVIIVNDLPFVYFTKDTICVGSSLPLSPNTGGIWKALDPTIADFGFTSNIIAIKAGDASFTFATPDPGCVTTAKLYVQNIPEITNGAAILCIGDSTHLSPKRGGTWASNSNAAFIYNNGIVYGNNIGTARFTFTTTAGCSSLPSSPVQVLATPRINNAPTRICENSTVNLNFTGPTSTWTSSDTSIASISQNQTLIPRKPGKVRITITSNNNSCSNFFDVEILPNTDIELPNDAPFCIGSTALLKSCSLDGIWESLDPSIGSISVNGIITGLNTGTARFRKLYANGSSSNILSVEIIEKIITSINRPEICLSGQAALLSPSTGGIWNSLMPFRATVTNTGLITASSVGPVSFSYNSSNGCKSDTIHAVVVYGPPILSSQGYSLCVGDTTTLSVSGNPSGYFFSQNASRLTVNETTGVATAVNQGSCTINFIASEGCNASSIFTIKAVPNLAFNKTTICEGDVYIPKLSSNLPINGTIETITPDIASVSNNVITAIKNGFAVFRYNKNDGYCPAIINLSVSKMPIVTIAGPNVICPNAVTSLQSNVSGTYSAINPTIATIHPNTGIVTAKSYGEAQFLFKSGEGCTVNTPYIRVADDVIYLEYERDVYISNGEELDVYIKEGNDFSASTIQIIPVSNPNISGQNSYVANDAIELNDILTKSTPGPAIAKYIIKVNSFNNSNCETTDTLYVHIDDFDFNRKLEYCAFSDINKNNVYDVGSDELLKNVQVSIASLNKTKYTNHQGFTFFKLDTSTYIVRTNIAYGDWESAEFIDTIKMTEPYLKIFKPFVPIFHPPSARLGLSSNILRCNTDVKLYPSIFNTGSVPLSGKLVILHNDRVKMKQSSHPYQTVSNKEIYWPIQNLGSFKNFYPNINVGIPAALSNNDSLIFTLLMITDAGDTLSKIRHVDIIRCSYDPNDKKSWPDRVGDQNYTLRAEELTYQIRFQNTGNDTAYIVRIDDILDPNLNKRSIQVLNSSHPVETELSGDTLRFIFDNINLVDSTTNPILSQGFVSFVIDEHFDIPDMTVIKNKVAIYFDKNDPIITNTTTNTIVNILPCPQNAIWIDSDTLKVNPSLNKYHWYDCMQDTIISSTSEPWWIPTKSGIYQAAIEGEFCAVRTACIDYFISDVKEIDLPNAIIYPNPTSDKIDIYADNPIEKVVITNLIGRVIMKYNVENQSQHSIQFRNLGSETYLAHIQTKKGTIVKRVVVID